MTTMATCGNCKATSQTVAHIRACNGAAALPPLLPNLHPGNVVTMANADGYWVVIRTVDSQPNTCVAEQVLASGKQGAWAYVYATDVQLWFPNVGVAADYQIELDQAAERAKVRETLHGDAAYCRGCAKGWYNAKWHSADCPVVAARTSTAVDARQADTRLPVIPQPTGSDDVWAPVAELRKTIKPHLLRKIRNAMIGHYAVRTDGVVKFYRIKLVTAGNYAGRVFVEAQASDTLYPVKSPSTLTEVLTAILADVPAAEQLYGSELGKCCRCNRTLTDETSRALGIGPECRSKVEKG